MYQCKGELEATGAAGPFQLLRKPTFNGRQRAPLDLLPTAAHQPLIDPFHKLSQVLRIRLHDLVKLCELKTHFLFVRYPMCLVLMKWESGLNNYSIILEYREKLYLL